MPTALLRMPRFCRFEERSLMPAALLRMPRFCRFKERCLMLARLWQEEEESSSSSTLLSSSASLSRYDPPNDASVEAQPGVVKASSIGSGPGARSRDKGAAKIR